MERKQEGGREGEREVRKGRREGERERKHFHAYYKSVGDILTYLVLEL